MVADGRKGGMGAADVGERGPASTWDDPHGEPSGTASANGAAPPGRREAGEGVESPMPGFVTDVASGSLASRGRPKMVSEDEDPLKDG